MIFYSTRNSSNVNGNETMEIFTYVLNSFVRQNNYTRSKLPDRNEEGFSYEVELVYYLHESMVNFLLYGELGTISLTCSLKNKTLFVLPMYVSIHSTKPVYLSEPYSGRDKPISDSCIRIGDKPCYYKTLPYNENRLLNTFYKDQNTAWETMEILYFQSYSIPTKKGVRVRGNSFFIDGKTKETTYEVL